MNFFTLHLRRMKGNWCLMKNPRFIESGRTAGNRLPSPGKVKKAVSNRACSNTRAREQSPWGMNHNNPEGKGRAADPPAGDTRARLSVNQPSQSLFALHSGSWFLFSPFQPRAIALLTPDKFNGIDSLQEKRPFFSLSLSFSFSWQRKCISWFNLSYCRPSLLKEEFILWINRPQKWVSNVFVPTLFIGDLVGA